MIINPFPIPTDPPPAEFKVDSVGRALALMALARENCLRASYLPSGGITAKRNIPVTHYVYVTGSAEQLRHFRMDILKETRK